ncbi:MAG: type II/IV secretion system protein [Candidatus Omnitrophica bacterium]|nr:type II/IV secretion system protein [Candidatus Omnitrophota bacterium]MDE2221906.1 type II/IV secretion system protein [Candidatus Omnitrophota bacterium]
MYKPVANKILVDVLVKSGLVSPDDAQAYIQNARQEHKNLNSYLIRHGILTEREIIEALSRELNLPVVDLKAREVPQAVIDRVPVKFASFYKFMPVAIEGNELTLAIASPLDVRMEDDIRVYLGLEPKEVLALRSDIDEALKKYYGLASDTIDRILTKDPTKRRNGGEEAWVEDIEKKSEDPSVAKLVNQIILEAYQKRATDIHIEPYRDRMRLRYRIDGVLMDANLPPEARHFMLPMISRIKIMSNLSITERRLPQDGSTVVRTKDQDLDLRISTMPALRGESMVIRILPTKAMRTRLEDLGLNQSNARKFRELIAASHGIIFVTGPTGSGKTTTLYACLHEINSADQKIITIEDPVEYEMDGVTQIQINSKLNFSFADGLRNILRHDPDIIMVGEVRDLETAEIAIRTALTGHLVFSTLHTNDAASSITRLIDMGVEPYLVASSVEAFVAQRLVRLICPQCKEEDAKVLDAVLQEMGRSLKMPPESIKVYRGRGCEVCNNTGYYGRTAIYEILHMDETIRSMMTHKPSMEKIKRMAMKNGMATLRQNGWQCVAAGITTVEEVLYVSSKDDWSAPGEIPAAGVLTV